MRILNILAVVLIGHTLFGQTGPAGVGTSANNPLWLKADAGTSTTTNGSPVSAWNDQSGNANNALQTTFPTQQPLYVSSLMNGMPAIQFDNAAGPNNDELIVGDNNNLDNTPGLTIFSISQPNTLNGAARAIVSKRQNVGNNESYLIFFFTGNAIDVDIDSNGDRWATTATFSINNNYLLTLFYDGTLAAASRTGMYVNETFDGSHTETSASIPNYLSNLTIGSLNQGDGRAFGGHIAEVIIYTKALNKAERIVVSNYLSAKYNITILAASDLYVGDNPGNGNYDFEVAGIGTEASGSSTAASSTVTGGLGITQVSGFQNGDYLIYGHQTGANSNSNADVGGMTGVNNSRWNRVWYLNVTNAGANENVNIVFNTNDGGTPVTPTVAGNYVLLFRAGQAGNWTELVTATSIAGPQITFSGVTITTNGYYTIGTRDNTASPLPIGLLEFIGKQTEKGTKLSWTTETELNNNFFTVERSPDGYNFEKLIDIPGAGNSSQQKKYTALDPLSYPDKTYYRLKQTDFNGAFTYSKVISVATDVFLPSFKLYPNPATGRINIELTGEWKRLSIKIFDSKGQPVSFEYTAQGPLVIINTHDFQKGLYVVQVFDGSSIWTKRVIIE